MQKSYRGTSLSSALNTMHFLLLFFLWQGVHAESTNSPRAVSSHSTEIYKGQIHVKQLEILTNQSRELSCNIFDIPNNPANITGYWKKNDNEIENTRQAVHRDNKQYVLNRTFVIDSLANYSCVFSYSGKEDQATFVFKVPGIKERDKPIVSYVGDSVILECHIKYGANTWQWYKANGTEKELINSTVEPMKYKIYLEKNITKLTVNNLTMEDSSKFVCSAVFDISTSEARVELKVLSFTEPLKPFIAIAAEVLVLVTLILLYEKKSHSNKSDPETTDNGPQSEQANKLTQDENNGVDGGSTTRQRKVE